MGILFDMAAFYRWLSQASDQELLVRRDAAISMGVEVSDEDIKRDLRRLVKHIEEEMVTRKLRV